MGNKRKLFGMKKSNTTKATQAKSMGRKGSVYSCVKKRKYTSHLKKANKTRIKGVHKISSLAVLCGRVIKKFKLLPEPKKFAPPETFSIVGGKPLRKRSERLPPEDILEEKRKKKSHPRELREKARLDAERRHLEIIRRPLCKDTTAKRVKMGKRKDKYYSLKNGAKYFNRRIRARTRRQNDSSCEEAGHPRCAFRRNPRSLAALCQIVVKEHNLLPECEETIRPSTSTSSDNLFRNISRKRGRPRKETKKEDQSKSRKGRPRKDAAATAASEDGPSSTVTYINYTTFLRQSQIKRKIKVEEELNLPLEEDPLRQDDDDYTVVVKEEIPDDEDTSTEEDPVTVQVPQGTSKGIVINPLASAEIPGPSREALKPAAHFMTVVMDEYQVFANSMAQQLRELPPNRALLLQLDIQSMIDNEKQLLMHETCD